MACLTIVNINNLASWGNFFTYCLMAFNAVCWPCCIQCSKSHKEPWVAVHSWVLLLCSPTELPWLPTSHKPAVSVSMGSLRFETSGIKEQAFNWSHQKEKSKMLGSPCFLCGIEGVGKGQCGPFVRYHLLFVYSLFSTGHRDLHNNVLFNLIFTSTLNLRYFI